MKSDSFRNNRKALAALLLCSSFITGCPLAVMAEGNETNLEVAQQQIKVSGVVKDAMGEPVIGASIQEKGTSNGIITDVNGNFSLSVNQGATLVISYIGFKTQEIPVVAGKILDVTLKEDTEMLEEVVVVGFGTQKKVNLTGSVGIATAKEIESRPVTSATQALQGLVPGLKITTSSGQLEKDMNISVRGTGTIGSGSNSSPLILIDGMVGDINTVNPQDIENISVLKDAAASSIYGSLAPFGVILVTTKSGRAGKTQISLNASLGFNRFYNETEVLSPYEYVYLQRELDPATNAGFFDRYGQWEDIDIYKSKVGKNWQRDLFDRTGLKQSYNMNINGGSEDLVYSLSYTHDDETYIMQTSQYRRDNVNLKVNKKFNKKLRMDLNVKMSNTTIDGPSVSSGSKLRDCVKYPTVGTLTDLTDEDLSGDDGIIENISSLNDPYFNIVNEYKKQSKFNNSYNAALIWDVIKGLQWRAEGTYGFSFDRTDNVYLKNTSKANQTAGQPVGVREYWNGQNWAFRTLLNYKFKMKDHSFDVMGGMEALSSKKDKMQITADYFPSDYGVNDILSMWNNGTSEPTYTTINEPSRSMSYFGRANYILKDRYYLTFTLRADGTNVFAPGNKWGLFPAASAAWRMSDEKFMEVTKDWLSNFKWRLSYGKSGNARVGSYWRQTYSPVTNIKNLYYQNEIGQSSLQPSTRLRNENLTWESKYSTNVGFDLGFFENRLNLTFDFYNDVTKNLIMEVQLPSNIRT